MTDATPRVSKLFEKTAFAVATALAVYGCAWVSYAFAARPVEVCFVWLGSGLLLAILTLIDTREWPLVAAGAFAGNIAADLAHGATPAVAAFGSAANVVESLAAAWLLVRFLGHRFGLNSRREVAIFLGLAAVASNAVTAWLGAAILSGGALAGLGSSWLIWWVGDGMGMLIVAPFVLSWVYAWKNGDEIFSRRSIVQAAGVFVVLAGVSQALLSNWGGPVEAFSGQPYVVFPILIWVALRFGPCGASTAMLIVSAVTVWNLSLGVGPFAAVGHSRSLQAVEVYIYLALASLSSIIPAAVLREQKQTERKLRESEQRFRQMAESINEVFFVIDVRARRVLYVSPTWAEVWGRPMADASDLEAWVTSIHPDERGSVSVLRQTLLAGGVIDSAFRIVRPDGSTRWIRGRAFPVRDEDGAVYRVAGVVEDVTGLRETEERLLQSQKLEAVGSLAGGIAHDFNNVLTIILGSSELALWGLQPEDPVREEIEAIRRAAQRAASLTRQLLMFSRRDVSQPKVLRPREVAVAASDMLERLIGENVRLALRVEGQVACVRADPGQLEQIIVNLAVNARDAMPDGGQLGIELEDVDVPESRANQEERPPAGRYVRLAVTDTGVGMDADTRRRMFEPFFTTKPAGKGTGLGLATVYGIVKQSGGHIFVQSEVGRGCRVEAYLPRVEAEPRAEADARAEDLPGPAGSETILVVEDDPQVMSLVQQSLARRGYHVIPLPDGEQALRHLSTASGRIDLLVTDVIMPGINGKTLADRFLLTHPNAGVLFVSGYTDDAVGLHGMLGSSVQYLPKPFTPSVLAEKVRGLLNGRRP